MQTERNLVIAPSTVFFAGQPLGFSNAPIIISQEQDTLVIDDIQQISGVADVRRLKVSFDVKMNLAETCLENIKLALGSNASVSQGAANRSLDLDFSGDLPVGELVINTKGPNNVARTIRFYRAKLTACGDFSLDARGYTVLPVTFKVIKHPDYTRLGSISEEYIPATPTS